MTEKGNPQKGHFGCGLMFNLLTSLVKNNPSNKLTENHTKDDKKPQEVHESFIETIVRAAVIITNIAEVSIPVTTLSKYVLEIKFKKLRHILIPTPARYHSVGIYQSPFEWVADNLDTKFLSVVKELSKLNILQ